MQARWLTLGFLVALGMGCGSDETIDTCDADSGMCDAAATGGTDEGTGGTDDSMTTGGTSDMTGGTEAPMTTGGDTTDPMDDDAGMDPMDPMDDDAGMDPMTDPEPPKDVVIKTDGKELAGCSDDRDCNKGLGCVPNNDTPERGYCSPSCQDDMDCTLFGDASSCSQSMNLCIQRCDGADDMSCMNDMTCQSRGGFPVPSYMCQYPAPPPPPVVYPKAWEECSNFGPACDGDTLSCHNSLSYCTPDCTLDSECTMPGSGSIAPSCQSVGSGSDVCVLDCSNDENGCPDGMTCQGPGFPGGGGSARCVYAN